MISSKRIRLMGQNNDHISIWDTENTSAGSSNSDQIKLPLEASGTYDFMVYWGDGANDHITAYNQAEATHTYSSNGTYIIRIRGQLEGFRFNNTGDKLKLLSIENAGKDFRVGNNNGYFYGCSNLTKVKGLNTSNITDMNSMFRGATNANPDTSSWDVSSVTDISVMFFNAINANPDTSSWDVSSVTNMRYMFYGAINTNPDTSSWDVSSVANMNSMFYNAVNANPDISSWDVSSVTDMTNMFYNATSWSTANYDAFLISAASQTVQSGVSFRCSSNYTSGSAAETARTSLINDDGWSITDLGGV